MTDWGKGGLLAAIIVGLYDKPPEYLRPKLGTHLDLYVLKEVLKFLDANRGQLWGDPDFSEMHDEVRNALDSADIKQRMGA